MIVGMIEELPTTRPHTPLLDGVSTDLDALSQLQSHELVQLAEELRHDLLYSVGGTGGHFGAGLGVVELTVALHHVFNTPHDRIVWDVGHQTYPHKILTGRRDRMNSMRQLDGLSGFPKRAESPFDTFGVGHSSTSISAANSFKYSPVDSNGSRKPPASPIAIQFRNQLFSRIPTLKLTKRVSRLFACVPSYARISRSASSSLM